MLKEDWIDFLRLLKKNWLRILAFLVLWLILGLGVYQLLFFIPNSTLFVIEQLLFSEPYSDENIVRFNISFWVSCGLNVLFFYLYFKQKKDLILLQNALQILTYLDPSREYMLKLEDNSLEEFDPKKDIVLGLILESNGVFDKFDFDDNRKRIANIVGKLNNKEWLYEQLRELDKLVVDNIEDWIKQHFPKKVYFIRLRLLEDYIQATKQGKYLVYDKQEGLQNDKAMVVKSKDEVLVYGENLPVEFYKLILNEYYNRYKEFQAQPVSFDPRLFRVYFTSGHPHDQESYIISS